MHVGLKLKHCLLTMTPHTLAQVVEDRRLSADVVQQTCGRVNSTRSESSFGISVMLLRGMHNGGRGG